MLIFGGVLVPALGFFNVYPFRYSLVADHFQYHASLALFALAGAGAMLIVQRLPAQLRKVAPLAAGLLLFVLAGMTFSQSLTYRNLETLYHDTIAKNPEGWTAYSNLGVYVESQGRHEEAREYFKKALELNPDDEKMQSNMGHVLLKIGERDGFTPESLEEAMGYFRRALELDPGSAAARRGLGFALVHAQRPSEAIEQFSRTLKLRPNDPDSWTGRARDSRRRRSVRRGRKELSPRTRDRSELRRSDPRLVDPVHAAGTHGRGDSIPGKSRGLAAPITRMPISSLAIFMRSEGALPKPRFSTPKPCRLRPKFTEAWIRLGAAYGDLSRFDQAIACFEQALALDPSSSPAQANLHKARELKEKQAAAHVNAQHISATVLYGRNSGNRCGSCFQEGCAPNVALARRGPGGDGLRDVCAGFLGRLHLGRRGECRHQRHAPHARRFAANVARAAIDSAILPTDVYELLARVSPVGARAAGLSPGERRAARHGGAIDVAPVGAVASAGGMAGGGAICRSSRDRRKRGLGDRTQKRAQPVFGITVTVMLFPLRPP